MRAFAQTQIHLDLPVFATLHDLTWSCESNDVQSVGLAATAPVPGRCVSCQTLRQTDSNEEEGGGGGCGGGGGVGVLHCSWSEAKTKSAIL